MNAVPSAPSTLQKPNAQTQVCVNGSMEAKKSARKAAVVLKAGENRSRFSRLGKDSCCGSRY